MDDQKDGLTATVSEPAIYINGKVQQAYNGTINLNYLKLTLEQAVELRDSLNDSIKSYRSFSR